MLHNNNNNNNNKIPVNTNNPSTNTTNSSDTDGLKRRINPKVDNSNKLGSGMPSSSNMSHKQSSSNIQQQQQQHGSHHQYHHHHHQSTLPNLHQSESKFYIMSSIELKEPLESTLEECYLKLQNLIIPQPNQQQSESALFNELSQYANQSKMHYDEISNALLYSILTDQVNSAKCLRNLFLCNNSTFNYTSSSALTSSPMGSNFDQSGNPANSSQTGSSSYSVLITNLITIITENYYRLQDIPRSQLIWLLKELTKAKVNQFDKLLLQMLRNIQSGLLSDKNIWLAETMLDILYDQTSSNSTVSSDQAGAPASSSLWLYGYNELMTQSVYTYLRLISDHSQSSNLIHLRQRETDFCCQVLREKWNECMLIGRDLVRLLQNISKISEFEQLWKDIMQSPNVLSPHFAQVGGLLYLMKLPTRRRCLISRLTVDMERKIYFIITSVKAGQQKRYQDWFQRQYLNTPESQGLRVDIIRYICVVVHPTNEQLNAGLTPRWAVCSWLLNTCTSPIDSANIKLALFFDWLFYDAKKDNIMLIEPGILLMFNSMRINAPSSAVIGANPVANLTSMLFDFLCRISYNYYWPLKEQVSNGIIQSFKDSIDKRVIPSMQIFFTQPDAGSAALKGQQILDKELRGLIQGAFPNFFQMFNINVGPVATVPIVQPLIPPKQQPSPADASSIPFKPKFNSSLSGDESNDSQFSSSFTLPVIKSEVEFKSEPAIESDEDKIIFKNEPAPAFSSEDEDQPIKKLDRQEQVASIINTTSTLGTISTATLPVTSISQLQEQLQLFTAKPLKIFTSTDDTNSIMSSLSMLTPSSSSIASSIPSGYNSNTVNILENHLNLIPSDNLRDKLMQLNEKIRDTCALTVNRHPNTSKTEIFSSHMQISNMFRDILNFIYRDSEFLSNFNTSTTDLAISICMILKNDFCNNLLPQQFYSQPLNSSSISSLSKTNNNNNNSNSNEIDIISGLITSSNSSHYLSLINEAILQRPIFVIFKELTQSTNQSQEREVLMQLLNEIYLKQNRIGYFFLFYIYSVLLKSRNNANGSSAATASSLSSNSNELKSLLRIYKDFIKERHNQQPFFEKESANIVNEKASSSENEEDDDDSDDQNNSDDESDDDNDGENDEDEQNESANLSDNDETIHKFTDDELIMGNCLMQDLRLCQQDDPYLFCFLLPLVFNNILLPQYMINNSELMYLIVSCIDSKLVKDLVFNIISQDLILLKEPSIKKSKDTNSNKSSAPNTNTNKKRKRNEGTSSKSKKTNYGKSNKKVKNSKKKKADMKKSSIQKSFKKESLVDVLNTSLLWESIEQIFFWDLLIAHSDLINIKQLLPMFNKLDPNKHSEATCCLFKYLKSCEPSFDLVKYLVQRHVDDNISRSLFIHWTRSSNPASGEVRLSQIFTKILNKSALANQQQTTLKKIKYNESLSTSNKKLSAEQQLELMANQKHQSSSNNFLNVLNNKDKDQMPTMEQVLSHLNKLRCNNVCINFILKENLLEALKKIYKKYCDDETKKKYADLFTLADEFDIYNDDNDNEDSSNEKKDDDNEGNDDEDEDNDDDNQSQNSNQEDDDDNYKTKSSKYKNKNKTKTKATVTKSRASNKRTSKNSSNSKNKTTNKKLKTKNQNSSESERDEENERENKKSNKNKNRSTEEEDDIESVTSTSSAESSTADSGSDNEYSYSKKGSSKKKNSRKGGKSSNNSSSSNQQPPRKKLKPIKNSDNDTD